MDAKSTTDLQTSYDTVAAEYVANIYDELQHKPLDRELLDRFAADVQRLGRVCDLGCGPGHVGRYLHDRGVEVFGLDISAGMLEHARKLNPSMEFMQGNMLSLDLADDSLGGIVAFYSIIHIPREEVTAALKELKRVLLPGGQLFLAFHVGDEILHRDELWDRKVSLDFYFFRTVEMTGYLEESGFQVTDVFEREPYQDVEHPSRRAYIFTHKPG
jgi:SAM-dependent methyltransferase